MSYSELKAFDAAGDAVALETFQNSHYIPVIWDRLAVKYGITEKLAAELAPSMGMSPLAAHRTPRQEKTLGYAVRGQLMEDMKPVCDLQHSAEISEDDWLCLMFTFDNVVVPPALVEQVAGALERLDVPENKINYGPGFAECMRKAALEIPGFRGIALHGTSLIADPWVVRVDSCDECLALCEDRPNVADCPDPEYRPYNLGDDNKKHWFLTTRGEHRQRLPAEKTDA